MRVLVLSQIGCPYQYSPAPERLLAWGLKGGVLTGVLSKNI